MNIASAPRSVSRWRKFGRFLFAGGLGFLVDLAAFEGLAILGHQPWWLARPLALFLALITTFVINRRLAFRTQEKGPLLLLFFRYLAASATGLAVNLSLFTLIGWMVPGPSGLFAFAVGVGGGLLVNFQLYDRFVFIKPASQP